MGRIEIGVKIDLCYLVLLKVIKCFINQIILNIQYVIPFKNFNAYYNYVHLFTQPSECFRNNLSYNLEILDVIKRKDLNKDGIWMSNISKSERETASNKYIS